MNHWEYKQAIHNYRQKSGHAINYYDGGAENNAPGSLAKDKMRKLHGKADSKSNRASKRKNVMGEINDTQ